MPIPSPANVIIKVLASLARLGNGAGVVFVFVALISAFVIIAMSEHDCGCRQQSEKTYCHREFGIEIHGLVSS
jgi:hypothetical protein